MIALLLETSGKQGFVALSEAGNLVAVRTLDESRRHARDLAPLVGEILRERQVSSLAVGVVAVSQGPGSYTGLRVGIASALAFRFATDCHMMLVPTFFLLARNRPTEWESPTAEFEVLGDALKGWVYHQRFGFQGKPLGDLGLSPLEQWRAKTPPTMPVLLAPGADLSHVLEQSGHLGICQNAKVEASLFGEIVSQRIALSDWNNSDIAEPLYLRPSSAELQMLQRQGSVG